MSSTIPLARSGCLNLGASGRLFILALPLAAWAPADGADPELEGPWTGRVDAEPAPLAMDLELVASAGSWDGKVSMPAQGMQEDPADDVKVDDQSVEVAFAGFAELRLTLEGDRLAGSLEGPQGLMDVELVRPDTPEAAEIEEELARAHERLRAAALEPVKEGPGRERVDPEALERLVDEARAAGTTSLVVLRDGELVGEWHRDGTPRRVEAMSVTKVALNLAAGRLLTLGDLDSLDMPVHRVFPQWSEGERASVTVRHLLSHTSGLESPMPAYPIYASDDFVRFALESSLEEEPGTTARYNNNATNLLAGLLGELRGEPLDEFLRDDLFAELGITDFEWTRDAAGNPHGMAGLQIRARDLARLGQLTLQEGEWNGERLIDADWFRKSLRPGSPESAEAGIVTPHSSEVGLIWFLLREDGGEGEGGPIGFMHSGDLGQYLVAYPEEELVGVRMVEQSPVYERETDAFPDFVDLLRDLAPEGE